jgi:hypothetical protein
MFRYVTRQRRLPIVAALTAMLLATVVSAPASADVPQGATFLDGSDLDLALATGATFTINLDVINGSDKAAAYTTSILNLQTPEAGDNPFTPTPDESGVLARTPADIPGGAVWHQSVTVTAGATGLYSGELVVTGSDGTIDQRAFRLTVSPSPGTFAGATSKGLAEPMPAITLSIERSSWIFAEANPAPDVFFPVDPQLAPRLLPGQLITATGERADLSIAGNGYVTITAHGPGAYKGVLARQNAGGAVDPMPLADITLNVRDDWWSALILLVIALVAGMWLEWFATDGVPKASLRVRLAQLRDAADKATTSHETWLETFRHWPGQAGSPRITGESGMGKDLDGVVTEISPYLVDASARALRDFNALGSLESRNRRWAADGEEYGKLAANEQAFESLLVRRQDLALAWLAFVAEMTEVQKHRDGTPPLEDLVQRSDTRRAVREALGADIIATSRELERSLRLVDEATATVGTLNDLAGSLWTIHALIPSASTHAEALDVLWAELAAMPNPATDVEPLRKAAKALLDAVLAERRTPGVSRRAAAANEEAIAGALAIAPRRSAAAATTIAAIHETPRDARLSQLWTNILYGALIVTVALIVGLAAQYYGNDTFGSIGDYLGMLVWGFGGVAIGGLLKNLGSVAAVLGRAR